MKILGPQRVHFYAPEDEVPHEPGGGELWQESFVIWLMDADRDVWAFLRLAQIPNSRGGRSSVWLNVWTPEHLYHRVEDARPLEPGFRTKTSLRSGNLCCYDYRDGDHHWTVDDPEHDVHLEIVQKDFHPGLGYFGKDSGVTKAVSSMHIQACGRVSGTVAVKGQAYRVSGMGWRDHGMGERRWDAVRTHRFFPAFFGPDLCTSLVSFVGADGSLQKTGVIIRNDTVEFTDQFDFVTHFGADGVSHCGGEVALMLGGERVKMRFESVGACSLNLQDGFCCADSVCKVTMGDRVAVGLCETSNNSQQGRERPPCHPPGVIDNGIHPRGAK